MEQKERKKIVMGMSTSVYRDKQKIKRFSKSKIMNNSKCIQTSKQVLKESSKLGTLKCEREQTRSKIREQSLIDTKMDPRAYEKTR
ncbi:hypothetical protein OXYTRIMIC_668 [Oxytricha trifallax]|uniref:Uncharacterized protein n=1 Tax=Oxytricha trifallax TaxID=1172189 RepID=A0A073HXV1_9SPIT|nr:hypothetical protein OXYTRIMIC_668 [Oxytricha trifallax]